MVGVRVGGGLDSWAARSARRSGTGLGLGDGVGRRGDGSDGPAAMRWGSRSGRARGMCGGRAEASAVRAERANQRGMPPRRRSRSPRRRARRSSAGWRSDLSHAPDAYAQAPLRMLRPMVDATDPGQALVASIRATLPELRLLTDETDRESYRRDETAYHGCGPAAAPSRCRRRRTRSRALVRLAAEHRVPIVPRGAGSGLSGGAAGVEGALTIALTGMNRILEIDHANLCVVDPAGGPQRRPEGGGGGGGAVLRPGSGELRDLLDRRQPRARTPAGCAA